MRWSTAFGNAGPGSGVGTTLFESHNNRIAYDRLFHNAELHELGARRLVGRPKSDAGVRIVSIAIMIVPEPEWYLRVFAEGGDEGRMFIGPKGATPLRSNFQKLWRVATEKAGVSGELHRHDLRHTGATYAAATGASTRELMKRLGHSTPRAALIRQHGSEERDRKIADGLDAPDRGGQEAPAAARHRAHD